LHELWFNMKRIYNIYIYITINTFKKNTILVFKAKQLNLNSWDSASKFTRDPAWKTSAVKNSHVIYFSTRYFKTFLTLNCFTGFTLLLQSLLGSARHLYEVCIYGAICLQIQKYFPLDPAIFSQKNKILNLLYIVYRFMQKISIFHGKTARFNGIEIKFVDLSHHRYKLRRDIE
jgi:hypothetical protein